MLGGKKRQPLGYTILETMIFLAISGLTFLMAVVFINGREARAQWPQAVNDLNSQIHAVVDDVVNGVVPSNSDFSCTATGSGLVITNTNTPEGTNQGCVFLGKLILTPTSTATSYSIQTIAGCQYVDTSNNCSSTSTTINTELANAKPTAISQLTAQNDLEWTLQVLKITDGSGTSVGGFGFFGSLGTVQAGQLQSGAQSVNIVTIPLGGTVNSVATTPGPITMCLEMGDRQGKIVIGDSGGQLTTTPDLENGC